MLELNDSEHKTVHRLTIC